MTHERQVLQFDPKAELRTKYYDPPMYCYEVISRGRIISSATLYEGGEAMAWLRARNRLAPQRLAICTKCDLRYDIADQPTKSIADGYGSQATSWYCPRCGAQSDTRHWTSHPFSYDHAGAAVMTKLFEQYPYAELEKDHGNWWVVLNGIRQGNVGQISKADAVEVFWRHHE